MDVSLLDIRKLSTTCNTVLRCYPRRAIPIDRHALHKSVEVPSGDE